MARSNGEVAQRTRGRAKSTSVTPTGPVAVVGVGVCQQSFASLEQLFSNLPDDLGAAYLIAVRQQDGLQVQTVVEALNRASRMAVTIPGDGEPLEPNHIYVGGQNSLITIEDGHVRARETLQPPGERGTVDTLLLSIAHVFHERSVAVVLDGLGSDGTAGVAETKGQGGLAIAEILDGEEPAEEAISAAGISDLRLPIAQIPGQVAKYIGNLRQVGDSGGLQKLEQEAAGQVARIANILRNVTGNDFHGYKHNTFLRRVARRMQVVALSDVEEYVARLRSDPGEVQHLFQDLLIGVTQFFRDPAEFELLERDAIPAIFKNKGPDDRVRVWVVGCATGEEAYSLAILIREYMARVDAAPHVQIFATDLDARALAVARAGRYPTSVAGHMTPERLMRWFVREGDTYRVAKDLREMCIFSPHNVLKDAPFSRVDLLSCRNLLIYLNSELQTRVIPIFHFALNPGGFLFLGNAENVTRHAKLFAPLDKRNRVFRRLETATRVLPDFPLSPRGGGSGAGESPAQGRRRTHGATGAVGRKAEQVAERFTPAYVVVDEQGDVLHFSGRTGRYLEPAAGVASLNVFSLVHRDLRLDLRSALQRAAAQGQRVETPRVPLQLDGAPVGVQMVVEPLSGPEEPVCLIVLFQESGVAAEGAAVTGDYSDEHVQRLEAELRVTKERLQATIEELESTNEELKSSNEEYQSINEELQSANEELETSKEELQSVNEELQTVNHELGTRVAELARANSDLKNLLESTQIATVFLDNELRIRNFTPAAVEVFHLIDSDVGRPISHIASRVSYPELQADIRAVIRTLRPVEREVVDPEGARRFLTRVLPYRSVENVIAGAVVTFMDVSAAARAEAALRESGARFRGLFQLSSLGQAQIDADRLRLRMVNPKLAQMLRREPEQLSGLSLLDLTHPGDRPALQAAWDEAVAAKGEELSLEQRLLDAHQQPVWVDLSAALLRDNQGVATGAALVVQEIGRRRKAEGRQRLLLAELQHRVRNTLAVVRQVVRRTAESSDSVEEYAAHLDGRINALARTQSVLTREPGAGVSLHEIVEEELLAHAAQAEQARVDGPRIQLQPKAGETLGLAIHELATNAVKYGALSTREGLLEVTWRNGVADGRQVLRFRWQETGARVLAVAPRRRGFGLTLIERTVPYELGATVKVDFAAAGLICEIEMPINETTVIPTDAMVETGEG